MEGKKEKKGFKRPSKKLFGRLLFWGLIGLICLNLLFFVSIRFLLPVERVKTFVTGKLSAVLDREVQVGKISINPFGRIMLKDVTVGFEGVQKKATRKFIKVKIVSIGFIPVSLFRKHLNITGLYVEAPSLHIAPLFTEGKAIQKEKKDNDTRANTTQNQSLPLSLDLMRLTLKDFKFELTLPDSSGGIYMMLDGVCLELSNIRIPDNFFENPNGLRGDVHLYTRDGKYVWKQKDLYLKTDTKIDIQGKWKNRSEWELMLSLLLDSPETKSKESIGLTMKADGVGFGESVRFQNTHFTLGASDLLHIGGNVQHIGPDMVINLSADGELPDLKASAGILRNRLPSQWIRFLEKLELNGQLQIASIRLQGKPEALKYDVSSVLNRGKVKVLPQGPDFSGIRLNLKTGGQLSPTGLLDGNLSADVFVDAFTFVLDDSTTVTADSISCTCHSRLGKDFLPLQGKLGANVKKIGGGTLVLDVNWVSPAEDADFLNRIKLDGRLSADSLDLSRLPETGLNLEGRLSSNLDLSADNLTSYTARFTISTTDTVFYSLGETVESIPFFALHSDIALSTENTFQYWSVDSLDVSLNDVLSARAAGWYDGAKRRFEFSLQQSRLQNRTIPDYLPSVIRKNLGRFDFSGHEEITAALHGQTKSDATILALDGKLEFVDAGLSLNPDSIDVAPVRGVIAFQGTPNNLSGSVGLAVDSILMKKYRKGALTGNDLKFDWQLDSFNRFGLQDGVIHFPSLGTSGNFNFMINEISSAPVFDGQINITFDSIDAIEVINDMFISGRWNAGLECFTQNAERNIVAFSGQVSTDSLSVNQQESLHIQNIRSCIPFEIAMNLNEKKFLSDEKPIIHDISTYEYNRTLYRHIYPQLGSLQFDHMNWVGYQITDAVFDLELKNGRVRIPWFKLHLFEGNMSGAIEFDLGSGDKSDVRYQIQANVSRINSSTLVDKTWKDEEDTELNATLSFSGKGIDPKQGIDLDGFFHLTKIGPRFASTLLQGMDPDGSDRSIRLTRRLLNLGWKPKLFSFEMRHGYVYPSIQLSQPWFSPIRLPEKLEYGRLPLAFFLKM